MKKKEKMLKLSFGDYSAKISYDVYESLIVPSVVKLGSNQFKKTIKIKFLGLKIVVNYKK